MLLDGLETKARSEARGDGRASSAASELSSELELEGKTRDLDILRGVEEGRKAFGGGEGLS